MPVKNILLVIALILFILSGLGVDVVHNILSWGLAFFAASFLPV